MSAVKAIRRLDFESLAAKYPGSQSPKSSWYIHAGVAIVAVASAQHITDLWNHLASEYQDEDSRLLVARRLREALLKSSPLVGFPRVRTVANVVLYPESYRAVGYQRAGCTTCCDQGDKCKAGRDFDQGQASPCWPDG